MRIRAKVHCTAAGLPEMDAPCEKEGAGDADDDGGDDASHMPKWHPLEKVGWGWRRGWFKFSRLFFVMACLKESVIRSRTRTDEIEKHS